DAPARRWFPKEGGDERPSRARGLPRADRGAADPAPRAGKKAESERRPRERRGRRRPSRRRARAGNAPLPPAPQTPAAARGEGERERARRRGPLRRTRAAPTARRRPIGERGGASGAGAAGDFRQQHGGGGGGRRGPGGAAATRPIGAAFGRRRVPGVRVGARRERAGGARRPGPARPGLPRAVGPRPPRRPPGRLPAATRRLAPFTRMSVSRALLREPSAAPAVAADDASGPDSSMLRRRVYIGILNSEDEEIFNNEEHEYASKKRKKDHFNSDTNTQCKNTSCFYREKWIYVHKESTKERHGYCTLGEAFNRLDFSSAIQDVRRFDYVVKLLQLIAKSQLTSLSGVAQKNYFNVLDKIVQKEARVPPRGTQCTAQGAGFWATGRSCLLGLQLGLWAAGLKGLALSTPGLSFLSALDGQWGHGAAGAHVACGDSEGHAPATHRWREHGPPCTRTAWPGLGGHVTACHTLAGMRTSPPPTLTSRRPRVAPPGVACPRVWPVPRPCWAGAGCLCPPCGVVALSGRWLCPGCGAPRPRRRPSHVGSVVAVLADHQNPRLVKGLLRDLSTTLCLLLRGVGRSVLVGSVDVWGCRLEAVLTWQQQLQSLQMTEVGSGHGVAGSGASRGRGRETGAPSFQVRVGSRGRLVEDQPAPRGPGAGGPGCMRCRVPGAPLSTRAWAQSHRAFPQQQVSTGLTLSDLPVHTLNDILYRLSDGWDVVTLGQVSPTLHALSEDRRLWKTLCKYHFAEQQFCRHLILSEKGHVEWKLMYFVLRKRYPPREQYGDTLHFCRHCGLLFWKDSGHPCTAADPASCFTPVSPQHFIDLFKF
ncbi:F-box only protein 25, partial [Galemys pyrenaicus]